MLDSFTTNETTTTTPPPWVEWFGDATWIVVFLFYLLVGITILIITSIFCTRRRDQPKVS